MTKFIALIPAAGIGSRIGNTQPKQYLILNGKPMIYHAIQTLYYSEHITNIVIVLSPSDNIWSQYDWAAFAKKLVVLNCGGATRAESVLNGLKALPNTIPVDEKDWILVHDAARPCLQPTQLKKLIATLTNDEVGGLLAIPVADTLKHSNHDARSIGTASRENLWQAQTPQMFQYKLLTQALSKTDSTTITDDASAVEALGLHPKLVIGDTSNLKVTYPEDLLLAELILKKAQHNDLT